MWEIGIIPLSSLYVDSKEQISVLLLDAFREDNCHYHYAFIKLAIIQFLILIGKYFLVLIVSLTLLQTLRYDDHSGVNSGVND